jgi:signal transduction histidine kinase
VTERAEAVARREGADSAAVESLDALWLRCHQRLVAHVAHDMKGALNGVSVNVEVVRGRAGRPERPVADVLRYADAASAQLVVVIKMATALLSIGRGVRGSAEVSATVRQFVALLEDTLTSDGAKIELVIEGGLSGATSAPPSAVRLALGEALLSVVAQKRDVAVRVKAMATPTVEIRSAANVEILPDIGRALADVGIHVKADGHGISMVFPAPTATPTEDA